MFSGIPDVPGAQKNNDKIYKGPKTTQRSVEKCALTISRIPEA